MTDTPAAPADVARQFHETYERLAPSFGYETRPESAVPWESVPLMNKRLMIAVVSEVLASLLAERELAEAQEQLRRHDDRLAMQYPISTTLSIYLPKLWRWLRRRVSP